MKNTKGKNTIQDKACKGSLVDMHRTSTNADSIGLFRDETLNP